MYIPKEFEITNFELVWDFIQKHPFATLISNVKDSLEISHLPLVPKQTDDLFSLEGHIALANPHHLFLRNSTKLKLIFHGEHGYISSSVYSHANVPTWNYQVVHIEGIVNKLSDAELLSHLSDLVHLNEKDRANPLTYDALDQSLITRYKREIIGFRIEIKSFEASFKLSQNRNAEDFNAIVNDLTKCPHLENLALEMKKNRD
jgi:transcriptional regulator